MEVVLPNTSVHEEFYIVEDMGDCSANFFQYFSSFEMSSFFMLSMMLIKVLGENKSLLWLVIINMPTLS